MLKHLFFILAASFLFFNGIGQNITRFEYFIDNDPGFGNGISVVISPADSASIQFNINITGLSSGHHIIGIRVKNDDEHWSHTEFRNFFIDNAVTIPPLLKFEYFIDADPGIGNGIPVVAGPADSVSVNLPIDATGLNPGTHVISVRAFNNTGSSLADSRVFYIEPLPVTQNITAGEYFFGDSLTSFGNGMPIAVAQHADSVTVDFSQIFSGLALGQHKIHLRFKDSRDIWSHQETRLFTVCTTYGPQADFIYQVEGEKVFFTSQSQGADTTTWKFGDNTSDTVLHPIKSYAAAGVYNVSLITANVCGRDTLMTPVEIRGLQAVDANRAGNGGVSSLMFKGFGFTAATSVKLISGSTIINPVSKFLVNTNRIRAIFDLNGATPGIYKAVATLSSAFDTLNNAVIIENNIPVDLSLAISGGGATRPNYARFISTISNPGSHDVVMVPFMTMINFIPGQNSNLNFNTLTDMIFLPPQGIFQHTTQYISNNNVPSSVMSPNNLDSARGRHVIAYYKLKVPAHSSVTELVINRNSPLQSIGYQEGAMVQKELMDSYALLGNINTNYRACYSTFLKHEVEKQLNISINNASWETCFTPAFDTLMKTLATISQNPQFEQFAVPMQAGFSALLASMADCGGSGVPAGLGGIQFKRIVQGVLNNWLFQEDTDSLSADCIDTTVQFTQVRAALHNETNESQRVQGGCSFCPGAQVFPEMCESCGPILAAAKAGEKNKVLKRGFGTSSAFEGCKQWCETTSIDPNIKTGPGDNEDRMYINHIGEVSYKIKFENLATATAPAAFVEIRDTIDKTVFDISSLHFGVLGWGDSVITVEPNVQNFSLLKDIRPAHPNQLRIDGVTDTASGEVRWRFWTVDTVTLQLTEDPTQGFLPPNTDGTSGEGYVTFTIKPNSSVTNGTVLLNRASIVFDENEAIHTDIWEHRIDTLKPSSAVNSLPALTTNPNFSVSWNGSDAHSGIDGFTIYVSVNDSAYKVWKSLTTSLSGIYPGEFGKTYKFISIALDKAGNFEDPPDDALNNPDAFTTVVSVPLPLDLLSFTARKTPDGKKVDLIWETAHEQNVSHFELQRSTDGINYPVIAHVPSQNNPAGATYNWQDASPLPKLNLYRLRMVDFDSSYKFSPVRTVRFAEKEELLVFPTLTDKIVFIQSEKEAIVELYNVAGAKLQTKRIGQNGFFDLSGYPAGMYFIRMAHGNIAYKIIKQ